VREGGLRWGQTGQESQWDKGAVDCSLARGRGRWNHRSRQENTICGLWIGKNKIREVNRRIIKNTIK
jgi:hypothetical protein